MYLKEMSGKCTPRDSLLIGLDHQAGLHEFLSVIFSRSLHSSTTYIYYILVASTLIVYSVPSHSPSHPTGYPRYLL